MTNLYDKALEDATNRFQKSVADDLYRSDFNWDQLIELILIEDSALQDVFSNETLQLADLCNNAKSLYQSYLDLSTEVEEGDSQNVCMEGN